jgi:ABC-type multidrug transport system permease subunit
MLCSSSSVLVLCFMLSSSSVLLLCVVHSSSVASSAVLVTMLYIVLCFFCPFTIFQGKVLIRYDVQQRSADQM